MDADDPKAPASETVIVPFRNTRKERTRRLLDFGDATQDDPASILYQHTVLCQTGLPYRNPGDDVRRWERINGGVHLEVAAGKAMHPELGRLVELGLPYGPKPRLILAHLNAEALRHKSPEIEVDESLTAFVRGMGLDANGRTLATIKDQLARLAASHITLGIARNGEALTVHTQVVTAFNLWFPKGEGQRVLWPSTVRLSADYFDSLTRHAVPLHDKALAALSGNAMALDVYAWLAQRLHRVDPRRPVLIKWPTLQAQLGLGYDRLRAFRAVFNHTLNLVRSQYPAARVELTEQGVCLLHSPPPVKGRAGRFIPIS